MNVDQLLKDAEAHFVARRFGAAAALYEEVLSAHPQHAEALANLGTVRFAQEQLAQAAELYQRARDAKPAYHVAGFGLARVHLARGQEEEALQLLQAMNRAGDLPESARGEFFRLIGVIHERKEDWDVASTFYGKYEAEAPDSLDPYLCRGRVAIGRGDGDALVGVLEQMVARFPDYAEARMDLLRLLGERGGYAAIKESLDRILARNEDNLPVYNLLAIASMEHRQYAYAYLYYLRARSRCPDFSRKEYPGLSRMEVFT